MGVICCAVLGFVFVMFGDGFVCFGVFMFGGFVWCVVYLSFLFVVVDITRLLVWLGLFICLCLVWCFGFGFEFGFVLPGGGWFDLGWLGLIGGWI